MARGNIANFGKKGAKPFGGKSLAPAKAPGAMPQLDAAPADEDHLANQVMNAKGHVSYK